MAIINLGTANDPGAAAGFSRITVSANAPFGTRIQIAVANSGASAGTVTDSQGNSYAVAGAPVITSFTAAIFRAIVITPLASGVDTITYTPPGGANSCMSGYVLIGLTGATAALSASGTGTTPSVSSTVSYGDLAVGLVLYAPSLDGPVNPVQNPGFSIPPNAIAGLTNSPGIIGGSLIAGFTGALSYAPMFGQSDDWIALLFNFPPLFTQVNSPFVMPYRVRRAPIAGTSLYYLGQARDVPPPVVNDTPSSMVIFRPFDGDWKW